jgi:hypothetical protein
MGEKLMNLTYNMVALACSLIGIAALIFGCMVINEKTSVLIFDYSKKNKLDAEAFIKWYGTSYVMIGIFSIIIGGFILLAGLKGYSILFLKDAPVIIVFSVIVRIITGLKYHR